MTRHLALPRSRCIDETLRLKETIEIKAPPEEVGPKSAISGNGKWHQQLQD